MGNQTQNTFLNVLATVLSVVFQPVLMPIFCMVLIYQFHPAINELHSVAAIQKVYILCITFTILLPLIVFGIFYKMGWVTDFHLTKRKERIVPFFISIALFMVMYYMFKTDNGIHPFILPILFGFIGSTLVSNIITTFWKISIHALGVSSVLAAVVASGYFTNDYSLTLMIFLTFLVVGVCWSRLQLNRHTPMQLVAGSLLGFLGVFLCSYWDIFI